MKFALEGISGLYNYGCEAIVRGTLAILRHQWPDCSVAYVSMRYNEDRKVLSDTDIIVLPSYHPAPLAKRGYNAMMRRLHLPFRMRVPGPNYWLDDVDCILSIGGDQYTLWPGEEDTTVFGRVEHAHRIMDVGKPFVLWGASVGPFEANPHAVTAFSRVLRRMPLVAVREPVSRDYLRQLGVSEQVAFMADPAYLMSIEPSPPFKEPLIALNLSPLSAAATYGRERMAEALDAQADIVGRIILELDVDVVLVPHVVCPWQPEDDDYGYLAQVHKAVPPALQSRVKLLPPDLGALKTKQVISACTVLVAARMHCAIAGLSTAVPTLLLSYSPKSIGMCEYIYGNRNWVLPTNADPDSIRNATKKLLAQARAIRQFLIERLISVEADALSGGKALQHVISKTLPATQPGHYR